MPEVAGRYSNKCAVCGYKPRDLEMYFRVRRTLGEGKIARSVTYSRCQDCRDNGVDLTAEELEKL